MMLGARLAGNLRGITTLLVAAALLVAAPVSADPPGEDAAREARAAQTTGEQTEAVDGLRITEMTLARNIEAGAVVDPTTTFSAADGRVMVLIRVENETGAETDIRVSFERADREVAASTSGGVTLHIPARPRYRTQARTGTRAPGRYRVVVRTAAGNVLGTADYEVTG